MLLSANGHGLQTTRPPFLAIAILSASSLAYEVLLLRLFSVIQWHHFAYMIISLALLGYGISGTFLALVGKWSTKWFTQLFAANAALFGLSSVVCFLVAERVPFNPLELLWDPQQILRLSIIYLLLALPFFFVANCIGLSFFRFKNRMGRIYGSDLLGAGTGALGVIFVLFVLPPMSVLMVIGIVGLAVAALALLQGGGRNRFPAFILLVAAALFPLTLSGPWMTLKISPYKELNQALNVSGARVLNELNSPLGRLTVTESSEVPFHYAPGLSLQSPYEPPEQLGVFTDSDSMTVINRHEAGGEPPGYLDYLTSALPYHLLQQPRVLVVGAGGGSDVLQALLHKAETIDAVELNPQMADLVKRDYSGFSGNLYSHEKVRLHIAEGRSFISVGADRYDLIQIALLDAFGPSSAGLHALSESYLYTVEALGRFLDRLRPGGMLAVTRWAKLPPRDAPKMFATAVAALRRAGYETPGTHLALIRSWKTSTLLIRNRPFTNHEIAALRRFCKERSFDVAYYPGIKSSEANRFNILDRPYYHEAAMALLGTGSHDFTDRYKYDIEPATDDRPYYFNFFKWRLIPELAALRALGGLGLLEWGYLVLVAAFAQAIAASAILIALPLLIGRREPGTISKSSKRHVLIYFLALGFAFLFIEISFIQKFILFLGHPLYAAAVVLSAFLISAGSGSLFTQWLQSRRGEGETGQSVIAAVSGIAILSIGYLYGLPVLFEWLMPLAVPLKIIVSLLVIAPLGFFMGMPFPLGLARLGFRSPHLVPWAWAINGCGSVMSPLLATLLAIHFGFPVVIIAALGFYALAALSQP